jgi:hypothetical protein
VHRPFALAVGIIVCAGITLSAQWRVGTKGVPMTPAGTPDFAAPAPRLANGTPDLSGLWDAEKRPCNEAASVRGCLDSLFGSPIAFGNISATVTSSSPGSKDLLPMRPWAEALVKQRRDTASRDLNITRCLPLSPPQAWSTFWIKKIIHTSDGLVLLDEYMSQFRQIFLDGRALPKDPEPSFKGYSVGRWEGETLVVDTIGFKDDLWLDVSGHPLTDHARTTERIRRVNYGNLEVAITVDDPKAYTKPWTATIKLLLAINTDLLEYICNENEQSVQHMVGPGAK